MASAASPLRLALGAHLGQVLTPEVAAAIEASAGFAIALPAKTSIEESDAEKPESMRGKVHRLEESMLSIPQADCPVRHYFAPGMYAREITIPKGVVLVGAIHKTCNLVVLSKGRLQLVTDDGTKIIEAPCTLTCQAGAKNAAYALEESVWTNFFPTDETDVEKLVELLTESKHDELLGGSKNVQALTVAAMKELEN